MRSRSTTSILQLPAHSQKTPLSVVGIKPTTFRLLVSLYIQANPGRCGGWVGAGWKLKLCVCVCACVVDKVGLGGGGLLPQCKEHTVSSPTTLWQPYIHHHPQHLCFSLLSLFIIPIPSLPPSIHPPLLPSSLSPAPISHECWCLHISLFFSLSPARSPLTPLARPPWVSFTSMMPHHYPCPTLSITQQFCHRAYPCTRGLIPIVCHCTAGFEHWSKAQSDRLLFSLSLWS